MNKDATKLITDTIEGKAAMGEILTAGSVTKLINPAAFKRSVLFGFEDKQNNRVLRQYFNDK